MAISLSFSFSLFWLLQLIALVSFLSSSSVSSSHCLEHQKSLLLQLKHELSFDLEEMEFIRKNYPKTRVESKPLSWNPTIDCCLWEGIKCDQSGYVIGLDLSESYVRGGINTSSSLFNLLKLQNLSLANNFLSGYPFPTGFSWLLGLTHLNLSESIFSGQIPKEISLLKRLESLDLSHLAAVELGDLEFFKNLNRLRVLRLDGVDMSIHDKKWCQILSQALPDLRQLSLCWCNLTGDLHPSLLNFKFLTHLYLNGNHFSQLIPSFFSGFSSLISLNLASNDFYGTFPNRIFLMPTLQVLDVSWNYNLTGTFPEFNPGNSLHVISLSTTRFSGKIPNSISNLAFLKELHLNMCGFYGRFPSGIFLMPTLQVLDVSSNYNLTGTFPEFNPSSSLRAIYLSFTRFSGKIPNSISNLVFLQELDLRGCSFYGSIPPSFGNFMELRDLNIGGNNFTGPIPSLGLSTKITAIDFSDNHFTGQLQELYNTSSSTLEYLDLGGNQLHGPIPNSIFNASNLIDLRLDSNQFTGTMGLHMMRNLNRLDTLDLSDNKISVEVDDTNSTILSRISELRLSSCNISSEFPKFLKNHSFLEFLDISNNRIRGPIPNWIWGLGDQFFQYFNASNNLLSGFETPRPNVSSSTLSYLDLHSNFLQGSFFLPPPSIFFFDYSKNRFSSSLPSDLFNRLAHANFISLSHNEFFGEIPTSLCQALSLEVLDFSNNNFNGTIPSCIGSNGYLKVLKLRNNKLHGKLLQTNGKKCSLITVDVNQNHLEGTLPRSLTMCRDLEVLDVGNNQLHGLFPFWLGNLTRLRVLILQSNNFIGNLNYSHSQDAFQMLQIIDLSSNKFVGRIPSQLFKSWKGMFALTMRSHKSEVLGDVLNQTYYQQSVTLTIKGRIVQVEKILTCIDLSNNYFEGQIPETLGDLGSLYLLNLSNNHFTGHIPSTFGKLKELESLDLSNNKLSGKIPQEFIKLTFLGFLNISNNHLEGKIPIGGQLVTFSASSFEGNNGLCGPPLPACPQPHPPPNLVSRKRLSKSFMGLDMDAMWIGFGLGGGFGINIGAVIGCIVANRILRRRGRRFR